MKTDVEFCHGDSDAEDEHLISQSSLDRDEEKVYGSNGTRQRTFTTSYLATLVLITSLLSVLLSGLISHFFLSSSTHQPAVGLPLPGTRFGSCGNTSSSAIHAGCWFDVMSFSWLPPACSDPELTEEFEHLKKWEWWVDQNRTATVPFEEVALGIHTELFVTRDYHNFHCIYMWRKLHRGLLLGQKNAEKRGIIDSYIGSYDHTSHCQMMLLGMEGDGGRIEKNATDTAILMKFPQCLWV